MKHLLIILSILLLSSPLFGQSERPETIIIPVSGIGDVSNTRKIILQNTLEEQLKEHFMLISQERFEEVREKVFEELEYEECTEDRCIMMIQEMLQVENVFHLQVIGEGSDTQLSLSWRTLEEKKKVNDICMGCGTFQLNDKVKGLVEKLVRGKTDEPVVVVSRDDEEELRKQREEELRRQREEELMRQKEEELRKQKEEEEESRKRKEEWLRIWNQFLDSLKIRGLLGSVSSGDTKVTNTSFYIIWKEYGLGTTQMSYKTKSSSNNKYEMNNSFLDFSYTYEQDWTVTVGLGNVTSGNGTIILDSSETKYSTTSVSGTSLFGVFGMEWDEFEGLLGFRFNTSKYSGFHSQSSLQSDSIDESYSISGGQFMFGFGFSF